jgi:hypothetical protein
VIHRASLLFNSMSCKLTLPSGNWSLFYSFNKDEIIDFQFQFIEGCGKTPVQQVVTQTICLNYTGGPLIERRRAKRFQVDWQIRVAINGIGGSTSVETGALRNISSNGALLSLATPLTKGAKLDVYIKLPLRGKKWMKYPASVVRVEPDDAAIAAIKFDSARPNFGLPLAPV